MVFFEFLVDLAVEFRQLLAGVLRVGAGGCALAELLAEHHALHAAEDTRSTGINLMETIGHGIRYAFEDDELTLIAGDEFIYETCSGGTVQIPVNLGNSPQSFHFYLEAWDGVNNRSTIDLNLDVLGTPPKNELLLSKVYPFPNPFSNGTHFTMFVSDIPANITITVYSLLGAKVIELPEFPAEESFIAIPWDGKSESGSVIANGAYFYHVKAEKEGKSVFEDIFKLAKVE